MVSMRSPSMPVAPRQYVTKSFRYAVTAGSSCLKSGRPARSQSVVLFVDASQSAFVWNQSGFVFVRVAPYPAWFTTMSWMTLMPFRCAVSIRALYSSRVPKCGSTFLKSSAQ